MSTSANSISAQRAIVVPRARQPGQTACLPLDQLLLPILRYNRRGAIHVMAPMGGGKSTALRHLRAVLPPDAQPVMFDGITGDWRETAKHALVIVASRHERFEQGLGVFELAGWNLDDCMEYLAATQRTQCGSVLTRLRQDSSLPLLDGSPQLLTFAMDRMAADPTLRSVSDALRRLVWDLLPDGRIRDEANELCLRWLRSEEPVLGGLFPRSVSESGTRYLRHRAMQIILSADAIATKLANGDLCSELYGALDRRIMRELVAAVRLRPAAVERLRRLVAKPTRRSNSMSATILLGVDPLWRPTHARELGLECAVLCNARWSLIDLTGSDLSLADLSGADLSGADLSNVSASGAIFNHAKLGGAILHRFRAPNGSFEAACLANARAKEAHFEQADLIGADLRSAEFRGAIFMGTNFERARLNGADLSEVKLAEPEIERADFSHATLNKALLFRVPLNTATWNGASFVRARLDHCNLEGMTMSDADFSGADLSESLFTGSRMHAANFRAARLSNCGLAEIEWQGADLRDADFTNASFHLGSSRSGLVCSVIPCEGSKTEFYTDEYNEQDYKCPGEIRKANLCGADLRGAKVEGTDWYLVDLRGAKYTSEQAKHFGRCGAILKSRVP